MTFRLAEGDIPALQLFILSAVKMLQLDLLDSSLDSALTFELQWQII